MDDKNDSLYCQKPVHGDDWKEKTPARDFTPRITAAIKGYHDEIGCKKRRSKRRLP